MAKKSIRLSVGAIFTKGPGKIYFYRYQVEGRRKTVSLKTTQREEALKKAQELIPIIQASTPQIVAAHVEYAKGFREVERNLAVSDIWKYYSTHPGRAIPATVNEQLQYQSSLQEFIDYLNNPLLNVREVTTQRAEEFSQHLKTTGIAVHTHNRKIKRIRKIFSTLIEFYTGENPFRTTLFRREREEQELGVPKAVLPSILGTDSEIADKYYTHIGEEAQMKAIDAVSGSGTLTPLERIAQVLAFLATLPACPEREKLESILRF